VPGAAARLLKDMGLWSSFIEQGHQPHCLSKSVWDNAVPFFYDSIRNLDGNGWHLNRVNFDNWLLQQASHRSAEVLKCSRLKSAKLLSNGQAWHVETEVNERKILITAKWLVDATGRKSLIAKKMGLTPIAVDKLTCTWLIGKQSGVLAQDSEIYADSDGWWYSSILPSQQRLLAFYTDSDLSSVKTVRMPDALIQRAQQLPDLSRTVKASVFSDNVSQHGFCAANSSTLPQYAGHRWLSVGDAAMCFDPLSSQGIFNALYTGLAASVSINAALSDKVFQTHIDEYNNALKVIWQTYLNNRSSWYENQTRWPLSEFWSRRKTKIT
jgi:flavin-dependent dehydrogenase